MKNTSVSLGKYFVNLQADKFQEDAIKTLVNLLEIGGDFWKMKRVK